MLLDVKKAFLYGSLKRRVYIELPPEDTGREEGRMMGLLHKAMYGLRDAPQVWQQEVRQILGGMGYIESKTSPCVLVIGTLRSGLLLMWMISYVSAQGRDYKSSTRNLVMCLS